MIKKIIYLITISFLVSFNTPNNEEETYTLKVYVNHLRNSKGIVQFTLYNKEGSIPDEKYQKFLKKGTTNIINNTAIYVFKKLPKGDYAINILHDENENGKIDKKFILPKEGIGFSNYSTIGLTNRPKFDKAKFKLFKNLDINIKIIYL